MFKYTNDLKVYSVGKAKVGGQPGQYPTVLAGSIFYIKHKIVTDVKKGIFEAETAEKLVRMQEEMSDLTGNPLWLQIVADYPEAMEKYITWYADIGRDAFLIDSTVAEAKMAGAKKADEIGLSGRVIYNSISASVQQEEIEMIRNAKFDCSIILGFNPKDSTVPGRMKMLTKGDAGQKQGMLSLGRELGIARPLIDVAATPLGSGSGATYRSIFAVKSQLGEPVGGGYHNITSAWPWLKKFKKQPGKESAYLPSDIGTNLLAVAYGCDYCLYGPIEHAIEVFPAVAMSDIIVAEAAKELGVEPAVETHPLFKLS